MTNNSWPNRVKPFVIFLLFGFLIFVSPIYMNGLTQIIYKSSLPVLLLLSFVVLRKTRQMENYSQVIYAFFIASTVSLFEYLLYLSQSSLYWLSSSRMDLFVYFKLLSTIIVVIPILILTKVAGQSRSSLFLKRGKLRLGLVVGLFTFFFFAASSIPIANMLYGGHGLDYGNLVLWGPWMLTFVLSNALKEEIQFRGLFLRRFEPLLGVDASNFLQALIFTLPHIGEVYSTAFPVFLCIVFLLGLGFGVVMQKTDSLLASVLFHAGADISVILGIFSNS
jgi:membrane protease YdiL (CAAX protease family)